MAQRFLSNKQGKRVIESYFEKSWKMPRMKVEIPEISWHNRDPVLSVDFQPKHERSDKFLRLASAGSGLLPYSFPGRYFQTIHHFRFTRPHLARLQHRGLHKAGSCCRSNETSTSSQLCSLVPIRRILGFLRRRKRDLRLAAEAGR